MTQITLLNTRPEKQAQALQKMLDEAGIENVTCPLLRIEWLALSQSQLVSLQAFDLCIFISVNAVEGLAKQSGSALKALSIPCMAVGAKTAQAIKEQGWNLVESELQQYDSEHLLNTQRLKQVQGQRILLVSGEGGRDLLLKTLENRGAKIENWAVYKRLPEVLDSQTWLKFSGFQRLIVLLTSVESFISLREQKVFKKHQQWLFKQSALVFSERIAEFMRKQGWQGPLHVVSIQSNQGILKALQTIKKV